MINRKGHSGMSYKTSLGIGHAAGWQHQARKTQNSMTTSAFLTTQLCDDWRLYQLYVRNISLLKMH